MKVENSATDLTFDFNEDHGSGKTDSGKMLF